ncbi:MAG: hypothetical protein O9353_09645, partial [Bacteroidia bacterium]|nr:hypothetical protein [Bacteroidia bacterium]
ERSFVLFFEQTGAACRYSCESSRLPPPLLPKLKSRNKAKVAHVRFGFFAIKRHRQKRTTLKVLREGLKWKSSAASFAEIATKSLTALALCAGTPKTSTRYITFA